MNLNLSLLKYKFGIYALIGMIAILGSGALGAPEIQSLTLSETLALASRYSPDLQQQKLDLENAKLDWDIAYRRLYFPTFSFKTNLENGVTGYQIPGSEATSLQTTQNVKEHTAMSGQIGFGISKFRLFNSWLDSIDLRLAEIKYEKSLNNFTIARRNFRFRIITSYYTLYQAIKQMEIAERDYQMAGAVVRLIRAQKKIGKSQDFDIQMAELDAGNSERRFKQAKIDLTRTWYNFQVDIGFEIGGKIPKLASDPKYFEFNKSIEELEKYFESSENMNNSKLTLELDKLNEDRTVREQFPIQVSLSAVSWLNDFGYYTKQSQISSGGNPEGNYNMTISLSIEFPLWGEGGWFNSDSIKQKTLNRNRDEAQFRQNRLQGMFNLRSSYNELLTAKDQLAITKDSLIKATALLTKKMGDTMSGLTNRIELKDLLTNTRTIELEYYQRLNSYIQQTISLGQLVGQDFTEGVLN